MKPWFQIHVQLNNKLDFQHNTRLPSRDIDMHVVRLNKYSGCRTFLCSGSLTYLMAGSSCRWTFLRSHRHNLQPDLLKRLCYMALDLSLREKRGLQTRQASGFGSRVKDIYWIKSAQNWNHRQAMAMNLLTPRSRGLPEKPTRPQLLKKFPAFYGTGTFVTAFTRARHLSLSRAKSIQSMPPPPSNLSKTRFNIILPSTSGSDSETSLHISWND